MSKQISFKKQAFEKLLTGLDKVADCVTGTIGPKGGNVIFQELVAEINTFEITNDGATVADRLVLADHEEDAGAWIIRNVTAQQNDDVGDGTTTVAVLTQALVHECLKRPENPMDVRASLKQSLEKVLKSLVKSSTKLKKSDIERVAYISAEDKQIAKLIAEIIEKLGSKAIINIEESKTYTTEYEVVDGFETKLGFLSPHFINDKKTGKAVFQDVPILVTEKKIANMGDVQHLWEQFQKKGIKQCVIVCDEIDDAMLGVFVVNKNMGLFNSVVIRAGGEDIKDIAGITGARAISDQTGVTFQTVELSDLGVAKKVIADANKTLFLGNGEIAKKYANQVEFNLLAETNRYIQERNQVRLNRLRGGVATLRIAAPTDTERTYLRRKAEDAVKATQAALEEGIVEGGGMALWRVAQTLKGQTVGDEILKRVLTTPLRKIVENAGKDYTEVIKELPQGLGYNAKDDSYVDMFTEGIVDPTKVEVCALENAVSTAATFITTHALITHEPKKD